MEFKVFFGMILAIVFVVMALAVVAWLWIRWPS